MSRETFGEGPESTYMPRVDCQKIEAKKAIDFQFVKDKADAGDKKADLALKWIGAMMAVLSALFVGKIWQDQTNADKKFNQDKNNQEQTASFLISLNSNIAVLQDHDKIFTDYMKQNRR